ncbi:MAG: response regulator [bacterium]|nr:response regulator [bacterium]
MSKKILIIDDEKWFFQPILERLEYEKIPYDFCKNGSLGLAKLKTESYAAIVLDMKVSLGEGLQPAMGDQVPGILIFKEIKKIVSDVPVICYTVLSDEGIKNKISQLGGKYFSKGGNEEEFINQIKRYAR